MNRSDLAQAVRERLPFIIRSKRSEARLILDWVAIGVEEGRRGAGLPARPRSREACDNGPLTARPKLHIV